MEYAGRTMVITGAARGIGLALAQAFHAEGARVALADLDGDTAAQEAGALDRERPGSAIGLHADVSTAAGNHTLVDAVEAEWGSIDLFFANAGVGLGTDLDTTEDDWATAFAVNVHAHRWAAARLLPGWLERGEGYFCSTASAAGLLSQIGSAPYTLTKHAAVAFAEWLSITYGDRGLRVSCLCPQGVNTAMLHQGLSQQGNQPGGGAPSDMARRGAPSDMARRGAPSDMARRGAPSDMARRGAPSDVVRASGVVLEPAEVAQVVLNAVRAERFLILPHPEVHDFVLRKATDRDRWLAGMRKLQARVMGPKPTETV